MSLPQVSIASRASELAALVAAMELDSDNLAKNHSSSVWTVSKLEAESDERAMAEAMQGVRCEVAERRKLWRSAKHDKASVDGEVTAETDRLAGEIRIFCNQDAGHQIHMTTNVCGPNELEYSQFLAEAGTGWDWETAHYGF